MSDSHASESRLPSVIVVPQVAARRVMRRWATRSTEALYRHTIRLLDLQLEDIVLEIGCGIGIGVEQAAAVAALGKVCGIEPSSALLAAAETRNTEAIHDGYVELRQGLAARLPWPDDTFSKAFALNSPRDWPRPVTVLSEARRVLRPGGMLALVIQPPRRTSREGIRDLGELWAHRLDDAGFHAIRYGIIAVGRASAAAITGTA